MARRPPRRVRSGGNLAGHGVYLDRPRTVQADIPRLRNVLLPLLVPTELVTRATSTRVTPAAASIQFVRFSDIFGSYLVAAFDSIPAARYRYRLSVLQGRCGRRLIAERHAGQRAWQRPATLHPGPGLSASPPVGCILGVARRELMLPDRFRRDRVRGRAGTASGCEPEVGGDQGVTRLMPRTMA
jgi:hypothetical protein